MSAPFPKNATFVTEPLLTDADAPSLTFAGAAKTAPATGFVSVTVGVGVEATTVIFTTADVADTPAAVAMAVRA